MKIRQSLLPVYYSFVTLLILITGTNSHPVGQEDDDAAAALIVALQPNTMNVPTNLFVDKMGIPASRQDILSKNQRMKRQPYLLPGVQWVITAYSAYKIGEKRGWWD